MRVVHCKRESYTVYIGRPSVFGNPYVIGTDGTRQQVIDLFETYARENLTHEIKQLKEDDVLGCWCKPQPCHGDIIIKLWREI
jgi:hypothetical protein